MKISTRGRYAVRLMLDLATNDSGQPIRLHDAAKRQNISEKYLEQIISVLNKAGFVKSVRGPQGGYLPAAPPSSLTVGSILRIMEGNLAPVDCVSKDASSCTRQDSCATHILWKKLDHAINDVVDNVTIQDLLDWQSGKG